MSSLQIGHRRVGAEGLGVEKLDVVATQPPAVGLERHTVFGENLGDFGMAWEGWLTLEIIYGSMSQKLVGSAV